MSRAAKTKEGIRGWLRKRRHMRFIRNYLTDLNIELMNVNLTASAVGYTPDTIKYLTNLGGLIRKYHRRLRWLRF